MLFYTTCGWMMWNWMASSLIAGAAVLCYDGFVAHPQVTTTHRATQASTASNQNTML